MSKEFQDRLYRDVLELQGVRNAVADLDGLKRGADYIRLALKKAGLDPISDEFTVPGFPGTFENIYVRIGRPGKPLVLLGAHYDSVPVSPGASDDGSGVALLLEAARHFAPLADKVNIILAFFTLEEGNPAIIATEYREGQRLGVLDKDWHYTTLEYARLRKEFAEKVFARGDLPYNKAYRLVLDSMGLPAPLRELLEKQYEVVKDIELPLGFGRIGLMGSENWAATHEEELKDLAFVMNFDEVSFASDRPGSQFSLPSAIMGGADTYKTDLEHYVGNFITTLVYGGAQEHYKRFLDSARALELPYVGLDLKADYATLAASGIPVLNSDHAPFFRRGVPALFITDMGHAGRTPFSHTQADTIERMNFDFFEKVVRAAIDSVEKLYGI
ncbi:MAG: M28 family peptidase [Firmicutes bacterium]|nr:M28 family peptidase [Bacillota bacterium]